MSTELVIASAQPNGLALHKQATDVAGAVREFAIRRCVTIQGKKYPPVEVWQAVANAFGCVASSTGVDMIEGGIRAVGEVRRISDGKLLATGEGFVGDDEKTWASRPMFARRAMAQTRSISRACRAAFAFVVPMIDEGLQTTPSEEMESVRDSQPEQPMKRATAHVATAPVASGETVFEAVLAAVDEKSGTSQAGKPWKVWFLKFDGDQREPGTFSESMATTAGVLQGERCRVTIKPGKKAGTLELVNIEPAPDDITV